MPYLEIATIVPVNLVDKNRSLPGNYHWKHFDAWLHNEQYMQMESAPCHPQKWQNDDIVFLQIYGDIAPVTVKVRNLKTKQIVLSHLMDQVAVINGVMYYQDQIALDNTTQFPPGYYQIEFYAGDGMEVKLVGEVWHIEEDHPYTMLAKYSNSFNDTVLWETGIYFTLRFDGVLPYIGSESNRTTYIDQLYNAQNVKNRTFRKFTLAVGTQGGEPKYMLDKLEEINGQTNIEYDGKAFAPTVGAKFNNKLIDRYGLMYGELELTEANNKRAKRFESDGSGINLKKWATTYDVEGALFGPLDGDANDNSYSIDRLT